MKKLLLLTLTILLAAPGFAFKTYFTGVELDSINSNKGSDVYQRLLTKDKKQPPQGKYTLEISETMPNTPEEADTLLDVFFWSSANERNEEGTYQQKELNYRNKQVGQRDAYISRTYYISDENGRPETAVFEVKRAQETEDRATRKDIIRFYTFTFEVKLQGDDISIVDYRYGGVLTFSPQGYFDYMVKNFAEKWARETNHLILEVFNK